MRALIDELKSGADLSDEAIEQAAEQLLAPEVPDEEKADFLIALRTKGETAGEIAAFVRAFLTRAVDPGIEPEKLAGPMLDVCGTGGDRMDLFNVSTTSMFVLAAGGAVIVKHGNRGITSKCGGADVLETLGVRIDLPPAPLKRCVEEHGVGFMFAPNFHPAFKAIGPVRRMLASRGQPTIFNLLGPLLNPARPPFQLVGTFSPALLPRFAHVLALLGRKSAWAVHGETGDGGGVDELSTMGPTEVFEVKDGRALGSHRITAAETGLPPCNVTDLRGGDCLENARILTTILDGSELGPRRDVVLLNAAAGFVITGLSPDLRTGIAFAAEQIDSGRALGKLDALRRAST